ncbi:hypothetical protein NL676_039033 [Syzygium grande]|nr:hypothetical protein NL676_039033 [Syzygium grande]
MSRRVANATRRFADGGGIPFVGAMQSKTRSSPLLPIGILVVGAILLIGYSFSGSGGSTGDGDAVSRTEGGVPCSLEVLRALPVLKKAYGDSMHKVLHVGPDTCSVVSQLLKEEDTKAWGVEPYDLDEAGANCKRLVRRAIVRVADIKFSLPYRAKSFSLVIVSDALDYLSPRYLNKTLPELARVSTDGVVIFTGYPGQQRPKVAELSKFGRPAKLRSSSWWISDVGLVFGRRYRITMYYVDYRCVCGEIDGVLHCVVTALSIRRIWMSRSNKLLGELHWRPTGDRLSPDGDWLSPDGTKDKTKFGQSWLFRCELDGVGTTSHGHRERTPVEAQHPPPPSPLPPLLRLRLPRPLPLPARLPDPRPLLPHPRGEPGPPAGAGAGAASGRPCDYSAGSWIYDPSFGSARYDGTCREIFKGWNCVAGGKPGARDLVRWRWKPEACDLPAFDPVGFLEMNRNTNIGFVGDSLNRNMFVSLFCSLKRVSGEVKKTNLLARYGRWSANDDDGELVSLGYKEGYRVDVDLPEGTWAAAPRFHDILIFNTGHWWWAPSKFDPIKSPMLFFRKGQPLIPPVKPNIGLDLVLENMMKYVTNEAKSDAIKFFRTQSPRHFEGGDWDQGGSCPRSKPLLPEQVEEFFALENNGTNVEARLVEPAPLQGA